MALTRTILALLILALAGCGPVEWRRPGMTAESLAADRTECRDIARRQAWRMTTQRQLFHFPRYYRDAHGRLHRVFDPFFDDDPFADRFFLENDLEYECLRAKGYDLVPVAP